ncbi:hypothetical protein GC101_27945 [Paenibacillus sp. LMG 31459]|uniref:Lipoprotein n=1 Tax=Paenibacillus phytohabitans TaxID=2654978 RepID=A0ABX1YSY8_9BACL|nr:hypothetical protein [Paenibacillus phytohabitans]NOU82699.1 hypothetical protein [Paenibacillus phytohabitans]
MNRKSLMIIMFGLFVLLAAACQKDASYDVLFRKVEEHRAVFAMTRDEAVAALKLANVKGTDNMINLDEELTAGDQNFRQRIQLDSSEMVEGYELVTRLPRSEAGYENAGEIVEAFLKEYKPSGDGGDKVLDSVHSIDEMTFPKKPAVKLVTESWSSNDEGTPMKITYRITNNVVNEEELSLVLQFFHIAAP